jgi:hypothetical protein
MVRRGSWWYDDDDDKEDKGYTTIYFMTSDWGVVFNMRLYPIIA